MTATAERTALYRYFDAAGVLLYVGISNDPDFRAKAHRYESRPGDWPKRAVRRTDEWHKSRADALAAEERAIRAEQPLFNEKHNYDDAPFDTSSWPAVAVGGKVPAVAGLMREEISSGRWAVGQRIPSLRAMGSAAGVSVRLVSKASVLLQEEGLLEFLPGRGLFVRRQRWVFPKLPHDWPRAYAFPG